MKVYFYYSIVAKILIILSILIVGHRMSCVFFETDLCDILTLPNDDGPRTTFFGVGLGILAVILNFVASKKSEYKSDHRKLISVKGFFIVLSVILGMTLTLWLAAWSSVGFVSPIFPLVMLLLTLIPVVFYIKKMHKKN